MQRDEPETADFIGEICLELRALAANAKFHILVHLLSMAELECRHHTRQRERARVVRDLLPTTRSHRERKIE
jgi:hypothetical protein